MIQLVAFLGNHGSKYNNTRHNVAWLFEKSLPFSHLLNWQKKFSGQFCTFTLSQFFSFCNQYKILNDSELAYFTNKSDFSSGEKIFFLKPETYMNASGQSILELSNFYHILPENILVVHDELELIPGVVSLKWSGGLGGHNGLRSTKASINTQDFWRLRFGIGRPAHSDIASYVLSSFTSDELILQEQTFACTHELFAKILLEKNPQDLLKDWSKRKLVQ